MRKNVEKEVNLKKIFLKINGLWYDSIEQLKIIREVVIKKRN